MYTYVYLCTCPHMNIDIHIFIYIYIYTYVCVHMQNNVKVCKILFKHRAQNLQTPSSKP